ncbi:MAG: hypothetical protein ACC651_15075, partial [Candidatus Scalindua sp.]
MTKCPWGAPRYWNILFVVFLVTEQREGMPSGAATGKIAVRLRRRRDQRQKNRHQEMAPTGKGGSKAGTRRDKPAAGGTLENRSVGLHASAQPTNCPRTDNLDGATVY